MHGAEQGAAPFAVDDPDPENPFLRAGAEIVPEKILDLGRAKSVEIELAFDRKIESGRFEGIDDDPAVAGYGMSVLEKSDIVSLSASRALNGHRYELSSHLPGPDRL